MIRSRTTTQCQREKMARHKIVALRSSSTTTTTGIIVTVISLTFILSSLLGELCQAKEYYYTRTRKDPNHLRISEKFKNKYVNEVKYESKINGTKYEYYKTTTMGTSYDELVFETIDKMFRHRLSPFYIHRYDNLADKKRSSDPQIVSQEACDRDLMYLVDKLPRKSATAPQSSGQRSPQFYEPYTQSDSEYYEMFDDDHRTPELQAFFDSYARPEAGLMMGNTYWVGAYDQCVNRHIFDLTSSHGPSASGSSKNGDENVIDFKGRYCVSALKSPIWDTIIEERKKTAENYFKSERQMRQYSDLFRLQVGICLPSSCDSTALDRHADEIKLLTRSSLDERFAKYDLIDLFCLPDETSPLRSWSGSAFNFLVFITIWSSLILFSTIADMCGLVETLNSGEKRPSHKVGRLERLVVWFSLRANYRKLWKVGLDETETAEVQRRVKKKETAAAGAEIKDSNPSEHHLESSTRNEKSDGISTSANMEDSKPLDDKDPRAFSPERQVKQDLKINLRFLNAFKVLIMFWIVNGHIMMLMIQTAKNILYSDALLNGLMHFLIGATFGVDLFFTMTGFLTSYLIFNSDHAFKMRLSTWLALSFHRYWRLAPMYLLAFWFSRSVVQQLGSGPLWDYGTSAITFRGLCNHQSWWYPLTLTSNLHGLFEECMITSWYISCDMQFWLVSPIFIHLLAKNPLHGWIASIATIIMSAKLRYDFILKDASARYDELVQPRADIFMRVSHDLPALYTHPHFRIAAYMVGLLAGHYVYMVKSGKLSSSIARAYQHEQETAEVVQKSNTAAALEVAAQDVSSPATKSVELKPTKIVERGLRQRQLIAYAGLCLFLLVSFVSYLLSHHYPSSLLGVSKPVAAVGYSVHHLIMSVGASLMIISLCFGQWSNIVKFLSHPHWTRLSKMNYALLLLQCEVIYFQIFRYEQVPVAGTRELINILFNLLVTLYPMAFLVTLAFEFPLANLEKLILPR